ncbi:hypothetical protein ACFL6T_03790 [Candidatus Zixiibacteriota bacterium]
MLGLKFTDRTFRFANLLNLHDALRLTSAGAGLIPFTSMDRGLIRPEGITPMLDVLDRSLDRESVERSGVVVVLDGRVAVRALFPCQGDFLSDSESLGEKVRWEIGTRCNGTVPEQQLHVEWNVRTISQGVHVIDAWGIPSEILERYEEVIDGVGCHVAAWDCDPLALTRFVRTCALQSDGEDDGNAVAAAHVEAESLEITLIRGSESVGATSLRSESTTTDSNQWNSDEPEAVAVEIKRSLGELGQRWFPAGQEGSVERVYFTGSVENPDSLLAALVRIFPSRIEMIDIRSRIEIDETLATSPLIESNLGSFALCIGGALAAAGS